MNTLYGEVKAIVKLIVFAREIGNQTRTLTKIGDPCLYNKYFIITTYANIY